MFTRTAATRFCRYERQQARYLSLQGWRKDLLGKKYKDGNLRTRLISANAEQIGFHDELERSNTEEKASVFRVTNLSAGPSTINLNVLQDAQDNFVNHKGYGMGLMEMSHRDANGPVQQSMVDASNSIRDLLDVGENYHVLWMAGGAHAQFAGTIYNCLGDKKQIDLVQSGFWANRFLTTEAERMCKVNIAWSGKTQNYQTLADASEWNYSNDSAFIHMCMNETIDGCEVLTDPSLPEDAPFVSCDATSTLLSRPVDIEKYGIVYASSGKNLGPAGVTCVIVRDDLLGNASKHCPGILNYTEAAATSPIPSLYNTPPTYVIYMVSRVLEEYQRQGGLEQMDKNASFRSKLVYDIFDQTDGFYTNHVNPRYRSRMTIPFRIMDGNAPELEAEFIRDGADRHIHQLFAHPLFPGLRVTMYNQLRTESVLQLAEHLVDFYEKHRTHYHPSVQSS